MSKNLKPSCMVCRVNPSVTIPDDVWTPMCSTCSDRIGQKIAVGKRAVCHIGSINGTVARFDDASWMKSSLAELNHDDGSSGWYPLAELVAAK